MKKEQRAYWKGWNACVDSVRQMLAEMPDELPLLPGHDHLLSVILRLMEDFYRDSDEVQQKTNDELATKYGLSRRTVQYWRRGGCDFSSRRKVMAFARTRRSLPAQFKAKFGDRLDKAPGKAP